MEEGGGGKKASAAGTLGFRSSSGETLACYDGAVGNSRGEDEEEGAAAGEADGDGARG